MKPAKVNKERKSAKNTQTDGKEEDPDGERSADRQINKKMKSVKTNNEKMSRQRAQKTQIRLKRREPRGEEAEADKPHGEGSLVLSCISSAAVPGRTTAQVLP